jgi:hypothetical protein
MIWEVHAVYEAELDRPRAAWHVIAPPNHNHRHRRQNYQNEEKPTMLRNAAVPYGRLADSSEVRPRRAWRSFSLAAAILAVVLAAAGLIAIRPGTHRPGGPNGDQQPGLAGQSASPTAGAVQSLTASPIPIMSPPVTVWPLPLTPPMAGIGTFRVNPPILCEALVPNSDSINVFTRPTYNGVVIGRIPAGTVVAIVDTVFAPTAATQATLWVYVMMGVGEDLVQGWASADSLALLSGCPAPTDLGALTPYDPALMATPTVIPFNPMAPVVTPSSTPLPSPTPIRGQ